jgi:uncharacterized membrane protein
MIVRCAVAGLRDAWRDDRGVGWFLPGLIVMTGFVAVICLSLVIDGGRVAGARRHSDAIAFQAARVAAQEITDFEGQLALDPAAASAAAVDTAGRLLAAQGLTGEVTSVDTTATEITVTVAVTRELTTSRLFGRSAVTVTGAATVRIAQGVVTEIPTDTVAASSGSGDESPSTTARELP